MNLRYASVCSGAEAFGPAWRRLGFEPMFHAEIEKNAAAVLRYHYPDVPNRGDFTTIKANDYEPGFVQLLAGGTPCQSFSIAGLRGGLADARGNLTLEFLKLADRLRPEWILWENVPGVLSSISHDAPDPCPPPPPMDLGCDGTEMETEDEYDSEELHAFNGFLAGLSELGYGFAYRVLDAQYSGVPQRRRRVFVVGHLGDWRRAAAVLFEPHSLQGHPLPRREAGKGVTSPFTTSALTGGGTDGNDGRIDFYVPDIVGQAMSCKWAKGTAGPAGDEHHNLVAFDTTQITSPQNGSKPKPGDPCHAVNAQAHPPAIAYTIHGTDGTASIASETDTAQCLRTRAPGSAENSSTTIAMTHSAVRRLMPIEAERLQGWPDNWTQYGIDEKGRQYELSDSARYRIIGNGWAAPVAAWIAERIKHVHTQ